MWQVGLHIGFLLIAFPAYCAGWRNPEIYSGIGTTLCGLAVIVNATFALHYLGFYL